MNAIIEQYQQLLQKNGVLYISVKVIPKAQKTEFVEILEDGEGEKVLKIKVAAVPEKGKANDELCRYLSKLFKVSKNSVVVSQGETSQRKIIKIVA